MCNHWNFWNGTFFVRYSAASDQVKVQLQILKLLLELRLIPIKIWFAALRFNIRFARICKIYFRFQLRDFLTPPTHIVLIDFFLISCIVFERLANFFTAQIDSLVEQLVVFRSAILGGPRAQPLRF